MSFWIYGLGFRVYELRDLGSRVMLLGGSSIDTLTFQLELRVRVEGSQRLPAGTTTFT